MQRQGGVLTAARGYVDASSTSSRVYLVSPTSVKGGCTGRTPPVGASRRYGEPTGCRP